MLEDATFADPRPMGEGRHVRFTVDSGGARARAVAFGERRAAAGAAEGEPAEATFTLEVNEWNGVSEPRLVLRQARPAAPGSSPAAQAAPRRTGHELVLFAPCPEARFDPAEPSPTL